STGMVSRHGDCIHVAMPQRCAVAVAGAQNIVLARLIAPPIANGFPLRLPPFSFVRSDRSCAQGKCTGLKPGGLCCGRYTNHEQHSVSTGRETVQGCVWLGSIEFSALD